MNRFKATDNVEFSSDSYSFEELVAQMFSNYMGALCGKDGVVKENERSYMQGRAWYVMSDQ